MKASAPTPDADLPRQHAVVDAFFAAAREGDLASLVSLLDPDVVLRAHAAAMPAGTAGLVRGAANVAGQALTFSRLPSVAEAVGFTIPVLVNGTPGIMVVRDGAARNLMSFTFVAGRITAIHIYSDPNRLSRIEIR